MSGTAKCVDLTTNKACKIPIPSFILHILIGNDYTMHLDKKKKKETDEEINERVTNINEQLHDKDVISNK